jgi:Ca-activated chloride channel family protein
MPTLMRCQYCGLLQDEPSGVKACARCGGELEYEGLRPTADERGSYLTVQMELDQISAPSGRNCDRYLLVTIRTPAQVPAEQAAPTQSGRPPLNFCAILDVSGSMQGEKIAQAKEAVRQSLRYLREGDIFSMVTFSNEVRLAFEPRRVDQNTRQVVESALQETQAGGMTALDGGLRLGLEKATEAHLDTNLALLLSDGQANVGETDLEIVGQRGARARQAGVIVSTLGIGGDYNEALMAEIATQGGGRFYHLESAGQIPTYLTGELGEVASLAARETTLQLDLPAGATLVPMSAAYPAQQGGGKATVSIGDIPSETELEIPLRLALPTQAAGTRLSLEGSVAYRSPAGNLLSARLNRVTVRFVEHKEFHLQDGVVRPVAERVLGQMKASHVLGVSRAYARSAGDGERQAAVHIAELREYASKLGEDRALYEADEAAQTLGAMAASPFSAKASVAAAFIKQRSTKDFKRKSG